MVKRCRELVLCFLVTCILAQTVFASGFGLSTIRHNYGISEEGYNLITRGHRVDENAYTSLLGEYTRAYRLAHSQVTSERPFSDSISLVYGRQLAEIKMLLNSGISQEDVAKVVVIFKILKASSPVVMDELRKIVPEKRAIALLELIGKYKSIFPNVDSSNPVPEKQLSFRGTKQFAAKSSSSIDISKDPVYGIDSLSPFMAFFNHNNESISYETGALTLSATDLVLKGRGGMDLVIGRTYSSGQSALYDMDCTQYTTTSPDGSTYISSYVSKTKTRTCPDPYGIGLGWRFNFPFVEDSKYLHMADGGVYEKDYSDTVFPSGLKDYYLKDIHFYDSSEVFNGITSKWILQDAHGTKTYFNTSGYVIGIKNLCGDNIKFNYSNGKLTSIIDSLGRQINIERPNATTVLVSSTVSGLTRQIEYTLSPIAVVTPTLYSLSSAIVRDGSKSTLTSYTYSEREYSFDIIGSVTSVPHTPATNKFRLISQVTYPNGRKTFYEWGTYTNNVYDPDDNPDDHSIICVPAATKRYDAEGSEYYHISRFVYQQQDGSRKYSEKTEEVSSTDTSNPAPKTERFYYDDHKLAEHITSGRGYKQAKKIYYSVDTDMPYLNETISYDPNKSSTSTIKTYYAYDLYRNLLSEKSVDCSLSNSVISLSSNLYAYHANYKDALGESLQYRDANLQTAMIVSSVHDSMNRLTSETRKIVGFDSSQIQAPKTYSGTDLRHLTRSNTFWNWVTPRPVDSVSFTIYWFAAAPWQDIAFSFWYRKMGDSWQQLGSTVTHEGGLFASGWDTNSFSFPLPGKDIYEIKVTANDIDLFGCEVVVQQAIATDNTPLLETQKESTTTSLVYGLEPYCSNLVSEKVLDPGIVTSPDYTISYEKHYSYDSLIYNNALPKSIYIDYVGNEVYGGSQNIKIDYEYDAYGNVKSKTDAKGNKTTYLYDHLNRLYKETHQDSTNKSINYIDAQNIVEVTDEDSKKQVYEYYALGYPKSIKAYITGVTNPILLAEKKYNSFGQLYKDLDAIGRDTVYEYDAAGRITKLTRNDAKTEVSVYDDKNRTKTVTDPSGVVTIYKYDSKGNLLSVVR